MNYWSNIEISPEDSEIIELNKFEKTLGYLSENVQKIRELIRRFEVCHFKYKEHLSHIKDSILNLSPYIEPTNIGGNHISKGKDVLKNDKTGRSIFAQQYVSSLLGWLGDFSKKNTDYFNIELDLRITRCLGENSLDKERLVRLLIARLLWDWSEYEEFQQRGKYKTLEDQACRVDICHYAFPNHLDLMLQGIGSLEPIDDFEGCGSFNAEIQIYIEKQFLTLCAFLKSNSSKYNLEANGRIKLWLSACLAKTLKEQVALKESLPSLMDFK